MANLSEENTTVDSDLKQYRTDDLSSVFPASHMFLVHEHRNNFDGLMVGPELVGSHGKGNREHCGDSGADKRH